MVINCSQETGIVHSLFRAVFAKQIGDFTAIP
jgi:hypothetical protein